MTDTKADAIKKDADHLKDLEKDVHRLKNIAFIIGVLAVIFGISGGWGTKALLGAKKEISELARQIDDAEKYLSEHREKAQQQFDQHVAEKVGDLDKHAGTLKTEISTAWLTGTLLIKKHAGNSPKDVKVSFRDQPFSSRPRIVLSARGADTYTVSLTKVTEKEFSAKICRVDRHYDSGGSGDEGGCFRWSGDVTLDWVALSSRDYSPQNTGPQADG